MDEVMRKVVAKVVELFMRLAGDVTQRGALESITLRQCLAGVFGIADETTTGIIHHMMHSGVATLFQLQLAEEICEKHIQDHWDVKKNPTTTTTNVTTRMLKDKVMSAALQEEEHRREMRYAQERGKKRTQVLRALKECHRFQERYFKTLCGEPTHLQRHSMPVYIARSYHVGTDNVCYVPLRPVGEYNTAVDESPSERATNQLKDLADYQELTKMRAQYEKDRADKARRHAYQAFAKVQAKDMGVARERKSALCILCGSYHSLEYFRLHPEEHAYK